MLDINLEFRKGILFIRLIGVLTKATSERFNDEVIKKMEDYGISNIVFNLSGLTEIDIKGVHSLFYSYELCKKSKGKTLVCNIDNTGVKHKLKTNRVFNYMFEVNDELSAFNKIYI